MPRLLRILVAAFLLAGLTVLAWQLRFEHAGPRLTGPFEPGLSGWSVSTGPGNPVNVDAEGVLTLSKAKDDPAISVERTFGTLSDVRFLRVALDARWRDARQSSDVHWARARAVIFGKTPEGRYVWPNDHALILANGTRDWHREEAIIDLPPDLGAVGFGLQHLGESGKFEARNVEISVVRQRPWFVAAATSLTALWIAWAGWSILPMTSRWRGFRAFLGGTAVVGAAWFLVFPQPRYSARPLIGHFELGPEIQSPAAPTPPAEPPRPGPAGPPPLPPTLTAEATPHPPTPPVTVAPAPEKREARTLDHEIRSLRNRFNFLHLVAFGALGVALFGLTSTRTWPIAAVIVFASEALPNYQHHQEWDWGDLGDLVVDGIGLALAAIFVLTVRRLWNHRRSRKPDSESIPES